MRLPQLGESPDSGPFWLPPAYFLAALIWLAGTAVGLLAVGPDLARGLVFQPRVFALTHALTLGVVGSTIFGALQQFIPAVLGVGPRHPRAAVAGFWLFQFGIAVLLVGFWRSRPAWQSLGWVLLIGGIGMASWNTLPALRRATRNHQVGLYVTLGHSALGFAALTAAIRIGDGLGWWHTGREGLLAAHLHLGALGFGTLTAVGFGSKMLPAFLGAAESRSRPLAWIGWTASAGLLLFSTGVIAALAPITILGGLLMLGAGVAHLALFAGYFGRRTRVLDPGLGFVLAALVAYAATLTLGAFLLAVRPGPGRLWAVYGTLALLGWLTLFIVGVMHRVVPRILTLIRVRKGGRPTPLAQRVELVSEPLGWASLAGMAGGTAGVALSTGLGWEEGLRLAAGVLAAGTVLLIGQGARVAALALRSRHARP